MATLSPHRLIKGKTLKEASCLKLSDPQLYIRAQNDQALKSLPSIDL